MQTFVLLVVASFMHGDMMVQDYNALRQRMVDIQIAAGGITDKHTLAAMRKVERHRFVPAAQRHRAYEDTPLPIGHKQTISQPYMVA